MAFRFEPGFRSRLLALPALALKAGGDEGAAAAGRGGRMEFREHRPYVPGDDVRDVDWNLYLRLGDLAVKEYTRDEAPAVVVLLDRSGSIGEEGGAKDRVQRETAAAIAYLALAAGSEVTVLLPGQGGLNPVGRYRSPRRLDALLSMLEALGVPAGPTWLGTAEGGLAPATAHGRVAFVFSDFLVEPLPARLVAALASGPSSGVLVHLVSDAERHPDLEPGTVLADPESERRLAVADAGLLLQAHAEELARHEEAVAALARRHGFHHAVIGDSDTLEEAVLAGIARAGLRR